MKLFKKNSYLSRFHGGNLAPRGGNLAPRGKSSTKGGNLAKNLNLKKKLNSNFLLFYMQNCGKKGNLATKLNLQKNAQYW